MIKFFFFLVSSHLTVVPVAANHSITTMFFPPTQLTASLSFCLFLFVKKYSLTKQNEPSIIVAKKWDPGILDPVPFSGQIRKVEARLGKLAKIRKVETD